MPLYKCKFCDYTTSQKSNYLRHLKSQKHDKEDTTFRCDTKNLSKNGKFRPFLTPNLAQNELISVLEDENLTLFDPNSPHFFEHLKNENLSKQKVCLYCDKTFSSVSHARRHMMKACKVKKYYLDMEEKNKKQKEEEMKERLRIEERHGKQINMLLEKVGNTTINNNCSTTNHTQHNTQHNTHIETNNTVQLNNYGSEDLTMLTENYMRKMVIYPYTAIPKMIKKIHFNEKYPANQNIRMLNKKDNKIQIRNNDKWEFVDKKETLEQLINEKNFQLDTYYENNKDKFEDKYQDRYDIFQDKLTAGERNVIKTVNTGSELIFWNSM